MYSSANSVQWDVNALEEFYTLCRKRFGCSLRKGQIAILKLSFQTVKNIWPSTNPRLLLAKLGARVYWDSTQNGY